MITIKRATEEDLKEILALQYIAYQSEAELFQSTDIPPLKQTIGEVLEEFHKGIILKAMDENGSIVGSVRAYSENGTAHIGKLMVHPEMQNRGLGARLLSEIEQQHPNQRYELFTSTKSIRNIGLYQKLGYTILKVETVTEELQFVYLEKQGIPMNLRDIVTEEHFYIVNGGKIHFYYDHDDDGYYLCNGYWNGEYKGRNSEHITQFYIPNTINGKPVIGIEGDTFDGMAKLSTFIMDDHHPFFRLYKGGLYTKDMKYLYCMPPAYRQDTFCVPDLVEFIMDSALSNGHIETLVLSKKCRKIFEYGVACAKKLKRIYLPKSIEFIGFKAFIWTSPEEVFYEGSQKDREKINFTDLNFNAGIINAKWHYECGFPNT